MKKLSLALLLAMSATALANQEQSSEITHKGFQPFVGFMVGGIPTNTTSGTAQATIRAGIWGGAEFNIIDWFGVRAYVNYISAFSGSSPNSGSSVTSVTSNVNMTLSANIDALFRVSNKLALYVGIGLGDIILGGTTKTNTTSTSTIENYFAMMTNYGVQYNFTQNHQVDLGMIVTSQYAFSHTNTNGTVTRYPAPIVGVAYSIMARYAYRF